MATFAELLVRIGGDATGFIAAMTGMSGKADQVVGSVNKKFQGLDSVISNIGGKLGAALSLGSVAAFMLNAAKTFEDAAFTIQRATGATGERLASLQQSFSSLYQTSGRSAEEIASALAKIAVQTRTTGSSLEALTKANLAFAKVTGTDVVGSVKSTQEVFKRWGIDAKDQAAALDLLYGVIKETGISVGSLTSQMAGAASIARTTKLSFGEVAAMIGTMEKAGVPAEEVLNRMSIMLVKLAKTTGDPVSALKLLNERIIGAKDNAEALGVVAGLGGRGGAGMIAYVDAVRRGVLTFTEMEAIISKSKGSVEATAAATETLSNKLAKLYHESQALVADSGLLDWTKKFVDGISMDIKAVDAFTASLKKLSAIQPANPLQSNSWTNISQSVLMAVASMYGVKTPKTESASAPQAAKVSDITPEIDANAAAATRAAAALKALEEEQARLNAVVDLAKLKYDALARAYQAGKASVNQLSTAFEDLTDAQLKANPEKLFEQQESARADNEKWNKSIYDLEVAFNTFEGETTKARLAFRAFSDALVDDKPNEQLQRMFDSASLLGEQMERLHKIPPLNLGGNIHKQTEQAIEDEKLLGIEGEKTAEKLRAAYERLGKEGLLTDHTRLVAKRNILAQEIKEAEAAGEKITDAQRKQLEEYEKLLAGHGNKIKSFWRELGSAIEGIAKNWAADIGRGLWDTMLGKDRRQFNAALDQQTADLQASLAERATEWAAYQAEIAAAQVAARKKYEDTLAEEGAALEASLAERRKDYADAEAEYVAALASVRAEYAKELEGTLTDLAASLEEHRQEYEGYVADIGEKLSETRQAHADQLAGQLRDLDNSLDDQRRSYALYVDDVNKRLSRVGEDYAESLDDETKQVKAGIAEKQKDYKRDEQDILEKIKRLKLAGKTEADDEVKDLRVSLSRKAEDLDQYIREAGEKLAEFTSDAKRENDRQLADLAESLKERTDEWTRYQAENATKRAETIASNAADLAKDEKALAKSLADRTADWVKYQAENAAKVTEANVKYTEGLAKEEAALEASLAKKKQSLDDYVIETGKRWDAIQAAALADLKQEEADLAASLAQRLKQYDQFKIDTETKLNELKESYRTAWGDIGGMMVSAFERAGESLTTFISTYLMGSLMDSIKKGGTLWSAFEDLGKKIIGVFSGGGAAASTIPSLPGAIPGASSTIAGAGSSGAGMAGAATSSAAAWVGVAATAIGTAITALGQAKMEGTLNAIEKEARYAQIHLYYLLERANLYWPKLEDIHWYLWNAQNEWYKIFDETMNKSESHLGSILKVLKDDIKPWFERLLWLAQDTWEKARETRENAATAAITAAVKPLVDAIETASGGKGETPSAPIIAGQPMPAGKSLAASLFDLAAIVAKRPSMKYGGPDWLETMRSMQEGTLANVLKGFDPNNPMGYKPTAAAYAENTGPAYQAWLTGAVSNTKDMLSKWAAWMAAVVEAQKAVADAVSRQKIQANINVFLNGRQVGNAMVEDLGLMGVTI